MSRPETELAKRLRLIVLTDAVLAAPRSVVDVVAEALAAGAPAIQLRNHGEAARDLLRAGREIRKLTRAHDALFFVNDRLDVARSLEADGIHVGPWDPPVAAIRGMVGPRFLIGRSADDPDVARNAVSDGASYVGCGTVYPTGTKKEAGEVIGLTGLEAVVRSVAVPVVAIGGITADRAVQVAATGAAGIAVVGAVMGSNDVAAAVRALMAPWR